MADTEKKQGTRRTYVVLKLIAEETQKDFASWREVGYFDAGSEAQARELAARFLPEAEQGGTYVAVARWVPHTADPQPVTQTRLVWS